MLTVDDLSEDEQIEYWHRVESFARTMHKKLAEQRGLRSTLSAEGVSAAAQDEVLFKMRERIERILGSQPVPDDLRDSIALPR